MKSVDLPVLATYIIRIIAPRVGLSDARMEAALEAIEAVLDKFHDLPVTDKPIAEALYRASQHVHNQGRDLDGFIIIVERSPEIS